MYSIQLTTIDGNELTLFFSTNLVVLQGKDKKPTTVIDGLHNNGGWKVIESYDEVLEQIHSAIHPKSCSFGPG